MIARSTQPPCPLDSGAGWPTSWPLSWPEMCDALRLDDAVMGQAYDSVAPALRACIKTGIAFQYALHGEQPNQAARYINNSAQGFAYGVQCRPAAWTMLFLGPDYASAPRLVAALMPALLARVPLVGLACLGALPSQAVCASLELLGVEDIFCLPDLPAAQHLLQQLARTGTPQVPGRALFLHKGELAPLEQTARRLNLNVWQEAAAPRIALHAQGDYDVKILQWCHPDAQILAEDNSNMRAVDAVFGAAPPLMLPPSPHQDVPLLLGVGTEGLWWHKNLEPCFFVEKQLQASCSIEQTYGESTL